MDEYRDKMEKAVNDTYNGLMMFVRDVDLPDDIARKYVPGLIILERAFTDASRRVMGMAASHRYAILSNHMKNLEDFEHGTNWGLCVANRNAHFKVLAVHEYKGKTLILLLHLPDDESWKVFLDIASINIDEEIISKSIQIFEDKCNADVIPELASEAWLERCLLPVGMDDAGNFFDLE